MGDPGTTTSMTYGIIRYAEPDISLTAEMRSLGGATGNKRVVDIKIPMHDFHFSPEITPGAAGLDVQGFTYIKHESPSLSAGTIFEGQNLEEKYFAECLELVKEVTGANKAIVLNAALRRKAPTLQKDPYFAHLKGGDMDRTMAQMPKNEVLVVGKAGKQDIEKSIEPVRIVHRDYTLRGLTQVMRYMRKDVAALRADDAKRYAAFSLWVSESFDSTPPIHVLKSFIQRPIKPVKRDGLAVMDSRTLRAEESQAVEVRFPSEVKESGEFNTEVAFCLPPKNPEEHKWYWMPNQQPDDMLMIKLADSAAENDSTISGGSGHCAPDVPGTEAEPVRESIEVRVLAVWE